MLFLRRPPPRRVSLFASLLVSVFAWAASAVLAGNDPGGGSPGAGANVTLVDSAATATLDNGVIRAVVQKATGKVSSYLFDGVQMVDPTNPIYYSMDGGANYEQPGGCVYSVVANTPDIVDISCKRTWRAGAGYKHVFDIDLHYVLRRGDTGLYAYAILDHPKEYPDAAYGEWRIVWKLPRDRDRFFFERAYVDELRHWEMPSVADYRQATATGIKEIVKLNTGVRAGRYDGKYSYSARYFDIGTWGHASDTAKKGVWFVLGGHDYFNDGPTKQDLTLSESYLLMHFGRNHYNSSTTKVAAGESWRKLFGPFLLYCNGTGVDKDAGDALWADAKAQVAAERAAWPYAWLRNADHPAPEERGSLAGKLTIRDTMKPDVSAVGARVGLAASEAEAGNWQFQGKAYQYWTVADAEGRFEIQGVRPGHYTLYAYNDGVVGEYSKNDIEIAAGTSGDAGEIEWRVKHPGASIAWEIGKPDRGAAEFRHGNDYFEPYLWERFPSEWSNPLVYRIGSSRAETDWNYVQCALETRDAAGKVSRGNWDWQVKFDLAELPDDGEATLTIAFASAHYLRLWLLINGDTRPFTRIEPSVSGGNALLRQGIHAKYSYLDIRIPVKRLRVGENTFTFRFGAYDAGSHVMYDYLRLELPGPSSG